MNRCTAPSRTSGEQCKQPAIRGGTVCRYHGGASPQVKAAAVRREAERVVNEQAAKMLSKLGEPTAIEDPLRELLLVAGRSTRLMRALEGYVDQLETIRYENTAGGEQLRAEIGAYMTMLDRCRAVLVDIVKLDIWDRLAKVEEKQVALFAAALQAGMVDAGLEDRVPEVRANVARHLRLVAG